MGAGELGRSHHRLVGRARAMRAMFSAQRAGEQARVLRQEAELTAELVVVPLLECRIVEPDRAALRPPGADHQVGQGRLAGTGGADNAQRPRRAPGEGRHCAGAAPRHPAGIGDVLDDEAGPAGRGRRCCAGTAGARRKMASSALAPAARPRTLPRRQRPVDRGQRPRQQDRGRDHPARGERPLEHEPGAEAQDPELEPEAQELGEADEDSAAIALGQAELARPALRRCQRRRRVVRMPSAAAVSAAAAASSAMRWARRAAVAAASAGSRVSPSLRSARAPAAGPPPAHTGREPGAGPRSPDEHRRPGCIEEGDHALVGEERLEVGERPRGGGAVPAAAGEAQAHGGVERGRAELALEPVADPDQDARRTLPRRPKTAVAASARTVSQSSVSSEPLVSTRSKSSIR